MNEELTTALDALPSADVRIQLTKQSSWTQVKAKLLKEIGSGKVKLTAAQKTSLMREATDEIVAVKPTGEIYVPGAYWRRVMNEVFDPMSWGLVMSDPVLDMHSKSADKDDKGRSILYREVFLVVKGHAVAMAFGAQEYHPKNARMSYDDAAEGAATNGLMRCCKALGVYANIWEAWAEQAKQRLCIKVKVQDGNYTNYWWRRIDEPAFNGEQGIAQDSPNRESYNAPAQVRTPKVDPVIDAKRVDPSGTEKIIAIRPVNFNDGGEARQYWVINTDGGDYTSDDSELVKALENYRNRGLRVRVTSHAVSNARGNRKVITMAAPVQA